MDPQRKVLLVFPGIPATKVQKGILVNLPLSILQLGAYIEERGYQAILFDMRVQEFDEMRGEMHGLLAVGFSCMTGVQIQYAIKCAKRIREMFRDVPFVWGGIHATLYPQQTAQSSWVDCAVKGEGEETFLEVLEAIRLKKGFEGIPGVAFKKGGEIIETRSRPFFDLEELPLPLYSRIDLARYRNILYAFDYQSSRGCPYRCDFCYNVGFNARSYRCKSASKVFAELRSLHESFGVRKFSFNDDEFFIRRERVEAFCDLVIESGLTFEWNASCRLNIIRKFPDALIRKIRRSGCRNLNFGAESGSPRILQYIHKDITVEDILLGAQRTAENGIVPLVSFMGGFPSETYDESLMTKDLITRLWKLNKRIVANGVFIFNPYPGNRLFEECLKRGVYLPRSLEEWGSWSFKYECDHPWVTAGHRRLLRVMFLIVRLDFYLKELAFRKGYSRTFRLIAALSMLPWRVSGWIRWRFNAFAFPIEWYAWAFLMKKIFGFI